MGLPLRSAMLAPKSVRRTLMADEDDPTEELRPLGKPEPKTTGLKPMVSPEPKPPKPAGPSIPPSPEGDSPEFRKGYSRGYKDAKDGKPKAY